MLTIILVVVIILALGGGTFGYRNGSPYGAPGLSIGGLLLLVLVILLLTGNLRL